MFRYHDFIYCIEFDPVYNLMDSYAAMLCCALIHRGMIESLILLGIGNEGELGRKARCAVTMTLCVSLMGTAQGSAD